MKKVSTSAIYHHLVPQTYMRSWKHGKSSIYFVKKGEDNLGESKSTKKIGGMDNYHSIQAGSLNATKLEYDRFFKVILDSYTAKVENRVLYSSEEMNNRFYDFDNWVIIDKAGKEISETQKINIENEIKSNYDKTIEEKWNILYEANWNNIKSSIVKTVSDKANSIIFPDIMRNELIKFMVSLEWRTKPYHPVFQESWARVKENSVSSLLETTSIPEEDRSFPFITTLEEEFTHYYLLNQFKKLFEGKGNIMKEIDILTKNAYIEFLIAPKDKEFLTSDNPVCRFYNQDKKLEYIFPVCPNIACRVLNAKDNQLEDKYSILHINKKKMIEYNNKLKENCWKGYILRVQNHSLYF